MEAVIRHYELSHNVNKDIIKLRLLTEKLQQKISSLTTKQTPSVTTAKASFADEVVAIDLTEDTDELSELIDTLDPKAIHTYFRQKKMELLKKPIEAIVKEVPCVWNTPHRNLQF